MSESHFVKLAPTKMSDKESQAPKDESLHQLFKSQKPKKVTKQKLKMRGKKADSVDVNQSNEEVKKEPCNEESEVEILNKSTHDLKDFDEVSEILKQMEENKDKVYLTKTEKKCLEEITKFTTKVRAPLDDRQMVYYNKEREKFAAPVDLKESTETSNKELGEVAAAMNESPSNIMATELKTLVSYLVNLKSLIARREMAWASTTENDYAQKAEIKRLKTEAENLRLICSKRLSEIKDKEQVIADKEQELIKWQKIVQKLKKRLLTLEKGTSKDDEEIGDNSLSGKSKTLNMAMGEGLKKSRLQMVEDAILAQARNRRGQITRKPYTAKEPPVIDTRRNQGPAAMLANALYNARNEGNFVNF